MKKLSYLVLALDALALLAFFVLDDIAKYMIDFFPECFFYSRYGVECATCGATRCVFNFFSLDFARAFGYNQFIFCLIVYALILFVLLNLAMLGLKFAQKACGVMVSWQAVTVWGVLFIVFAAYRIAVQV